MSIQEDRKLWKSESKNIASVCAFRPDGKFLMGLRGDAMKFCLPGGHFEPGESALKAAVRELFEETGLRPEKLEYLGSGAGGKGGELAIHCFRAEVNPAEGPTTVNDPDSEFVGFRWLDPGNIPEHILANLYNPKDICLRLLDIQDGPVAKAPVVKAENDIHYHGTQRRFKSFKVGGQQGQNSTGISSEPVQRHAIFFTKRKPLAHAYAGPAGHVREVQLTNKNPIDLREGLGSEHFKAFEAAGINTRGDPNSRDGTEDWYNLSPSETWSIFDGPRGKQVVQVLQRMGHDGALLTESDETENGYAETHAVFDPRHVKILKTEELEKRQLDPSLGYTFSVEHVPPDNKWPACGMELTRVYAYPPGKSGVGNHIGYAVLGHKSDGQTLRPSQVVVDEAHQRRGIASAMYAHAEKSTGKRVVPSEAQTDEGRALWAGNTRQKQFGPKNLSEHLWGWNGTRKSEPLAKGAMQRLAPFNPQSPEDRLEPEDEAVIARWQGAERELEDRMMAPDMAPSARRRALHKLMAATTVRTDPATGTREYLLHRGVSPEEYKNAAAQENITHPDVLRGQANSQDFLNHDEPTSWTPQRSTARRFASDYRAMNGSGGLTPHHILSAWVPEDAIGFIPKQYGRLSTEATDEMAERKQGENAYSDEHEVIVNAHHNSRKPTRDEVESYRNIDGRVNAPRTNISTLKARLKTYRPGVQPPETNDPLEKAVDPRDFKSIRRAETPAGPELVDHLPQMQSTQQMPHAKAYHAAVLLDQRVLKPMRRAGLGAGISKKLVYRVKPVSPQMSFDEAGKPQQEVAAEYPREEQKFLVKPYHERPIRRTGSWVKRPHLGWAEAANQALYHAAGIGDLHQRVHVAEHDFGDGPHQPALVVRLEPGMKEVGGRGAPKNLTDQQRQSMREQARKIAVMDMLTNNLDRHGGNLMVNDQGKLLAIDHGRSFQYIQNGDRNPLESSHDTLGSYIRNGSTGIIDPWPGIGQNSSGDPYGYEKARDTAHRQRLANYEPIIEQWWPKHSEAVRGAMQEQLKSIKDPGVRAHIWRNFEARAKHLDEMANFGVGNYGLDDWHQHPVPIYKPGELTEEEQQEEQDRRYRQHRGEE